MPNQTRCSNGTRKNRATGKCEKSKEGEKKKRCPKGTRRSQFSGNCESYRDLILNGMKHMIQVEHKPVKKISIADSPCPVCLKKLGNDSYKTNCGHHYHKDCFRVYCTLQHIDNGDKECCMVCGKSISAECDKMKPINSSGIFYQLNLFTWPQTAVWKQHKTNQIFRFLDNESFNPNVKNDQDESVLQVAIQRDMPDVVENLLKRSNIRVTDEDVQSLIVSRQSNKSKMVTAFKKHKKIPKALKGLV
jgi:hypothetical protein